MKSRWGVRKKALAGIIIFELIVNILTCAAGSLIFDRSIQKQNNERGYVIANIILNDIDHDKIAQYAKTWEPDEYYPELEEYLHHIEEYSNAAYIYIAVPYEDGTMKYIYDSDSDMGFVDPIAASFDEIWECYTKGIKPKSYLVRHSKLYGYLTSSCLPVKDSNGNVVALLFVDTNMEVIRSTLYKYIANMIIISLVLLAIFCVVHYKRMEHSFIKPILVIMDNVRGFAQNNAQPDDSLKTINSGDEIEFLARDIENMEKDIVKYIDNIQAITAEKERIGAELNVATKIQADMLPRLFPAFPDRTDFDIYATMTPAKEVGGDFYDFFLIDDDHMALVMADVSGKGVPAALFMVITKTLIKNRTQMARKLSPAEILYDVNNQLCEGNEADLFVTVWLGIIELSTGKGIAANAGHEHPAMRRAGGQFELDIYKHSPIVAGMENLKYLEREFEMNPGDSIFLYTDGVTEASNKDVVLYKTDRLLAALNKDPDADVVTLVENVKEDIQEFVGDTPQFDDITMLCFKYLGNE